jgi:hypothetical protein
LSADFGSHGADLGGTDQPGHLGLADKDSITIGFGDEGDLRLTSELTERGIVVGRDPRLNGGVTDTTIQGARVDQGKA